MQIRTTQLTILSAVFVGMMMVFLGPSFFEEAQATIVGNGIASQGATFTKATGFMTRGIMIGPEISPTHMVWATHSGGLYGDENGGIIVTLGKPGDKDAGSVIIHFINPAIGKNTCNLITKGPFNATCHITQGVHARATLQVSLK